MNRLVYRLMSIIVTFALVLGGHHPASAAMTAGTTFTGGFETAVYQYPNAVNNWLAPTPYPPGDRLIRVSNPVRKGRYSLKVTVKPGDNYGSSGERAEVFDMYGPDGKRIVENETSGTQFYAISVYLPLNFVSPHGWGTFQQLHSNDIYHSYPPFAIGATNAYYVQLMSGDLDYLNDPTKSHTVKYKIGALQKGKWVDFIWKIKFAKTFTGSVDVWRRIQGQTGFTKVLSVANIPTLMFKSSVSGGAVLDAYWKTGYYTSRESFTRVIYVDCNTRGDNFNDVVAAAFPPATATFIPKADATVSQAYPATNFGAATSLRARGWPTVDSYLRFSVSGLGGLPITRARLLLYSTSSSSSSLVVRPAFNDSWGETSITYNNAPSLGDILATSSSSISSGTWITLNVSSYVQSEGTYNFGLTTANINPIDFASRESGSHAPKLVLTLGSSPTVALTPTSSSQTDWHPSFLIRAALYYPWIADAWKQDRIYPYTNYTPLSGYYSSTATTLRKHIGMMQ